MFGLGNKFGGARRNAASEASQEQGESADLVQDAQEAAGLATNLHQVKLDELAEARVRLPGLDRTIGEKGADGIDADLDILERQTTLAKIQQLEATIAVLMERKTAADNAVLQAEAQAQSEKVDAALARLAALGPRGEGIITAVNDFMTDLGLASDALRRVGGNERFLYPLTEIRAQWDLFLSIAKRPASSRGIDSGAYRKYSNFTECLEAICGRPEP